MRGRVSAGTVLGFVIVPLTGLATVLPYEIERRVAVEKFERLLKNGEIRRDVSSSKCAAVLLLSLSF